MKEKTKKKTPLKVLYLEDSPKDVDIISELLIEAGFDIRLDCADKKKEFTSLLRKNTYDIILSGFKLPGFDAFGALKLSVEICPDVPFICVSGSIGEEIAIELIKEGAVDYVLKDRIVRLPSAITRALNERKEKDARRQIEEALYESEARFQVLAENSPVGIFQTDAKGSTVYVNPRWCQIAGLTIEEALGNGWLNAVHSEDKALLLKGWEKATKVQVSSQAEYRFVHKNGTITWVIGHAVPQKDDRNKIIGYIGTITDITERKMVETTVQLSRQQLKSYLDNAGDAIYILEAATGHILNCNVRACQDLGYSKDELLKLSSKDIESALPSKEIDAVHDQLRSEDVKTIIGIHKRKDGTIFPVEIRLSSLAPFQPGLIIAIVRDITDRKRAEEALQKSEEKFRSVVETALEGIWFLDSEFKTTEINNAVAQMLGYTPEEIIGRPFIDFVIDEDRSLQLKEFQRRKKGISGRYERRVRCKDGSTKWLFLSAKVITDAQGVFTGTFAMITDITERKRMEEAMLESETKFRAIFENSASALAIIEKDTTISMVNKEYCRIGHFEEKDVIGNSWTKQIAPDDLERLKEYNRKRLIDPKSVPDQYEFKFFRKDGEIRHCLTSIAILPANQKIICSFIDITERKRIEEELANVKTMLEAAFEQTPVPMVLVSMPDAVLSIVNTASRELLGITDEPVPIGQRLIDFKPSYQDYDDRGNLTSLIEAPLAQAIHGNKTLDQERRIVRKDGTTRWASVSGSPIYDMNGNIIAAYIIFPDITKRKLVEETLHESQERFSKIFRISPVAISIVSLSDGKISEVNEAWCKLMGFSEEEAIGNNIEELRIVDHELRSKFREKIQRNGFLNLIDGVITVKTGEKKSVLTSTEIITISGIQFAINLVIDITERKQAEEELQKSEEKFRLAFNTSPDSIAISRIADGVIVSVNDGFIRISGYTREEVIGKTASEIMSWKDPEDRRKFIEEFNFRGKVKDFEAPLLTKTGEIHGMMSASIIDLKGTPHILVITRDITERKRIEEALRESEIKLIEAMNIAKLGTWEYDVASDQFRFNDQFYALLHTTAEREGGYVMSSANYVQKFGHPDDTAVVGREIQKALETTDPNYHSLLDCRIVCTDGEIRHLTVHIRVEKDANGRTVKTHGVNQDITERKLMEDALRESERNYRELIDGMNETVWVIDFDGNIIDVNNTAVNNLGYTKEELLSIGLYGIDSSLKKENIKALAEAMPADKLQIFETSHRTKDGRAYPVEVYSSLVTYHGKKAILSIARDITERRRAQEDLQESERRFRSLYENTTIGLYRTTPDGKVLLANPALVKMLGYSSFHELAERNLEKDGFESSSQRKEFLDKIERDTEITGYDSKWIRKDGKIIFVLESARAIRDSQGKTLYYDGTVEDITERKQMEEQLRQMQKLEGLGTLAGGIAHDFNNILGIILAYNTGIRRFKDDTKKLDLATETITKAVERGKSLVNQILTFARKTESAFGAVNVNDVVMEIMLMIFETFPKVLNYAQNFEKGIPFISADRSQLYQALLNLSVNARDAMPNGGLLSINTSMVPRSSLYNQHPDIVADNYVCIEVSDTGEGMTEETRNRIFEPFFTTKGIGKGTGLGLSVVFGVVQSHKGFVEVESELGKGTTFRLYLPALQAAEPAIEKEEETLEEISGGTETMLVVEDEEMLMMSLQMILFEKGYNVLTATEGFEALKVYQENKNDIALVLTDLGLPGITGLEVCQRIKKIKPNERMIIATGYLSPEMKSECLKAGILHFLYKPYDLKKVLKEVREVLDNK